MPYKLSIPGQVTEFQLRAIEAVASLVPEDGTAVEIGSLFGRSSYAWGASIPSSARLYCIDPWMANEGVRAMEERLGIKYSIEQFKTYTADCPAIVAVQGYSPRDVRDWERKIDLFYEDSVHQNPVLRENLDFWSGFLKPTGVACGDDFRPRFPDVMGEAEALGKRLGRDLVVVDKFWCLLPSSDLLPAAARVRATLEAIRSEAEAYALSRARAYVFSIRTKPSAVAAGDPLPLQYYVSNESPVIWKDQSGDILSGQISVTIAPEGSAAAALAAVIKLPGALMPDLPIRGEAAVATVGLRPGLHMVTARLLLTDRTGLVKETFEPGESWSIEIGSPGKARTVPPVYEVYWEDKHPDWNKITELDVHAAYRIALGRAPEGGGGSVQQHLANAKDLPSLRQRFLSSPEFYRNNVRSLMQGVIKRGSAIGSEHIETVASPQKLIQLFQHIQDVWSRLGEAEPHYSVLSSPQFKPEALSQNEQAFYASGEREIAAALQRVERLLGASPPAAGVAVEFGCGVGRVTRHIGERFLRTAAYDISKPHLELARQYLEHENVRNVDLHWVSRIEDLTIPEHDFFYSRIVFQHNPPPVTRYLLELILSRLRPGGVAMFQLLTGIEGYNFDIDSYLGGMEKLDNQELHAVPQQEVFQIIHSLGLVPVEAARDSSVTGFDKMSMMFIAKRVGDADRASSQKRVRSHTKAQRG